MKIFIEKNVKIPILKCVNTPFEQDKYNACFGGNFWEYIPFKELEIKDSFFIKFLNDDKIMRYAAPRLVENALKGFNDSNIMDIKLMIRLEDHGIRVWRVR